MIARTCSPSLESSSSFPPTRFKSCAIVVKSTRRTGSRAPILQSLSFNREQQPATHKPHDGHAGQSAALEGANENFAPLLRFPFSVLFRLDIASQAAVGQTQDWREEWAARRFCRHGGVDIHSNPPARESSCCMGSTGVTFTVANPRTWPFVPSGTPRKILPSQPLSIV